MYKDTNTNYYNKYLKYKNKYLTCKYIELLGIYNAINIKQNGGGIIYPMTQIYPMTRINPLPQINSVQRINLIPNYIINIELIDDILRVYYINGSVKDLKLNLNKIDDSIITNQLKDIIQDKLKNITDQIKALDDKIKSDGGPANIQVIQVKQEVGKVKNDMKEVKENIKEVKQNIKDVQDGIQIVKEDVDKVEENINTKIPEVENTLDKLSRRVVMRNIILSK